MINHITRNSYLRLCAAEKWLVSGLLLACLVGICSPVSAAISAGHYYDPAHSGHGVDLRQSGDAWILIFFSYDDNDQPTWFLGVPEIGEDGSLSGDLQRYDYAADRSPRQQLSAIVGSTTLIEGGGTCTAASALEFQWEIDGSSGTWCLESLLQPTADEAQNISGHWYAGSADAGWGLSLQRGKNGDAEAEVFVLYYYDGEGQPRWSFGATHDLGSEEVEIELSAFTGYCRSCTPIPLTGASAGTVSHQIDVGSKLPRGSIDVMIEYPFAPAGLWQRTNSPLVQISDPEVGVIALPDVVSDAEIAYFGVDVLTMEVDASGMPFPAEKDQVVIIQNGVIKAIGKRGRVAIGEDAVVIDGRGQVLFPGLTEMHQHIAFGGQKPANESGLLAVANGVTTMLNMGDGLSLDINGLGDQFFDETRIGPTLYSGNVAYGPQDGGAAQNTVGTAAQATNYVQTLNALGYDFIKVYWQLPIPVIDQFYIESSNFGMPIIGHAPLRQPLDVTLQRGQKMLAHIQEPWKTWMNETINDAAIPITADMMIENGTYITPTLAVFESYTGIYGGNTERYNEFIARDGTEYVDRAITGAWRNYFNSRSIQGAGQTIGQLDALMAFFNRMTKAYGDAGVQLLIGTDAPGFPGLATGYAVHWEMELMAEAGLSNDIILKSATYNAGKFIDETLAPEVSFGTVSVGKRADLVLVDENPMDNLNTLRKPRGVMVRGYWRSAGELQSKLDILEPNAPPFIEHSPVPQSPMMGPPRVFPTLCADHMPGARHLHQAPIRRH